MIENPRAQKSMRKIGKKKSFSSLRKNSSNRIGKRYDAIIIGAGSIGVPIALGLAEAGEKVLVIDKRASVGQGENKHAIGGIRATHSERAKILTALRSLEIVSTWEQLYGDDIEWVEGGYLFVVYRKQDEETLKSLLHFQHSFGLRIDWIEPDEVESIMPGINRKGLRGGTFSPQDGNISPLLLVNAYERRCLESGVDFSFKENVVGIKKDRYSVSGVITDKNEYRCDFIVNAAGANAKEIGEMAGIDIPVIPDSHEAGITEPVKKFFEPMVVDIRPGKNSKNYYFYQNALGQIIFCLTPAPPMLGVDTRSTSDFLPQIAPRMIDLVPRLKHIKVRRVWRGLYPMTPDGGPLVGEVESLNGFIIAAGMCGQGLMLGPGIGELVARLATDKLTRQDYHVLKGFSSERDYSKGEVLK
jgi:sarcosine oxidase subunit beta